MQTYGFWGLLLFVYCFMICVCGGFRGRFCDEEQIMCDGTNSFRCEHGARCNEIVHGEDYTCICQPGYSGTHCEHIGAPCGQIFCFHEAECLEGVEGDACECPADWRGSSDCSKPTVTGIQFWTSQFSKLCLSFLQTNNINGPLVSGIG